MEKYLLEILLEIRKGFLPKEIVSMISIGNGVVDIIVSGMPNIKKVWRKV